MDLTKETRGLRNNNPGNIRHGNNWKGEVVGDDRAFESFEYVELGIRAIFVTLNTYRVKYKLTTVKQIIERWAPPSENNTNNYIVGALGYMAENSNKAKSACDQYGEQLDVYKLDLYPELIAAIIYYENGYNPFNEDFIESCRDLL